MKKIVFDFPQLASPPFSADCRLLSNVHEGPDIDALRDFIIIKMPAVKDPETVTTYHVLFTERDEASPASALRLRAIVEARCTGRIGSKCWDVEGFYEIKIVGCVPATVTARKLEPTGEIHTEIPPLPSVEEMYRDRVGACSRR